jgi:hypothetical protein
MDIKISDAYKALAQLELASKNKSLKMSIIKDEMETAEDELIEDIKSFNNEIIAMLKLLECGKKVETKESLVKLRASAMDIETTFSNLVEEIDTFFQNTDLYEE